MYLVYFKGMQEAFRLSKIVKTKKTNIKLFFLLLMLQEIHLESLLSGNNDLAPDSLCSEPI